MKTISRRQFMKWTGAAAAGVAGLSSWPFVPTSLAADAEAFEPDVEISLRAAHGKAAILEGEETFVWSFVGTVTNGPEDTLKPSSDSYLGPTFRFKRGQKVRIRLVNELAQRTIVHWHGLHVPDTMDGHPRFAVGPNGSYTYEFEILNRAGTYWYHPHPHGLTGPQVYGGLAGLLIVEDDQETTLGLPKGDFDIPLVIQDRVFDRNNQLVYLPGGMMDRMNGMLGDRILVNGKVDNVLEVASRAYRLRILNASNARIYRLAWDDGMPLWIIGTDGGLLDRTISKRDVLLGPGERIELWADFSGRPSGAEPRLVSLPLPFNAAGRGMMGRMMGGARAMDDMPFTVQQFKVARISPEADTRPESLLPLDRYSVKDARNSEYPRRFQLAMSHMQGTINGRVFVLEEVAPDEIVELDALEVWEFDNRGFGMGMMNMPMPHPMHIHGVQFQVIDRIGGNAEGFVDKGWKDTVLVPPGEKVRVMARFGPYKGMYLYHCHNLEHEDGGMMRNFSIM